MEKETERRGREMVLCSRTYEEAYGRLMDAGYSADEAEYLWEKYYRRIPEN